MNKKQFDNLIWRYQNGLATESEVKIIDAWLKNRRDSFGEELLSQKDIKGIKKKVFSEISLQTKPEPTTFPIKNIIKYAAVILLILTAGYSFYDSNIENVELEGLVSISTDTSNTRRVLLEDGSIVWLQANSTLSYPKQFDGNIRKVTLQGEALFEIASVYNEEDKENASKPTKIPFVVESNGLETRVLGTSFIIKSQSDQTKVLVLTGKVLLKSKELTDSLYLEPNQEAVFELQKSKLERIDTLLEKQTLFAIDKEKVIAKTEYDLKFDNEKMSEVMIKLEKKFDIQIDLSPDLANCLLRADFTDQSLDNTMDFIAEVIGAKVTNEGEDFLIQGSGCFE